MDLVREAAATDARDIMSQSMIRGDRLLHSERTSNKRKAHMHAVEAHSPIAPVMPPEVAELRARQERLTTAMKLASQSESPQRRRVREEEIALTNAMLRRLILVYVIGFTKS